MAAVTTQDFVEDLCARFPEDEEDLRAALEVLTRQRLGSLERLARLSDSHWQRLEFPLGIEALLRDEAASALAPAAAAVAAPQPPPAAAAAPQPPPPSGLLAAASAPASSAGEGGGHGGRGGPASAPRRRASGQGAAAAAAAAAAGAGASGGSSASSASSSCAAGPAVGGCGGGDGADEDGDDGSLPLEPFEPSEGLYRRGGAGSGGGRAAQPPRGGSGSSSSNSRATSGAAKQGRKLGGGSVDFLPPDDLESLWQQLLEDTLPPDKRPALQDVWESTDNEHDRYMMFLEYSSYLRKPEVTEEEKAERRKQLEPLMREFGLKPGDFDDGEGSGLASSLLWWILLGVVFLVAGIVYYSYTQPDPAHDLQAL